MASAFLPTFTFEVGFVVRRIFAMGNQEMDLDTYYAEQEIRLNLPHESIEQYQQRLSALRFVSKYSRFNMHLTYLNSQDQHVNPFSFPATWEMSSGRLLVGHSGNVTKRKMPLTQLEAADKRQRIDDQADSIDHPHLSSSGQRDLGIQAATIQQHAIAESDANKCDLNGPPSE